MLETPAVHEMDFIPDYHCWKPETTDWPFAWARKFRKDLHSRNLTGKIVKYEL